MSEHQKETAFLRQCLLYDDTDERHKLEERITQAQRDERCVRHALWLMVLLAALAIAGLNYTAVFLEEFPQRMSIFATQFIVQFFCVLSLGSLICILAFVGLGMVYRKTLDQRREECRRLATKLLESRLGKPRALKEDAPDSAGKQLGDGSGKRRIAAGQFAEEDFSKASG
jgi:formate hydrogenlyase subunit 3/multisubunit Na+/H+ antiporter MnhD subunit